MANHDLLRLSAEIVSAHATHNPQATDALPDLIRSVYGALSGVGTVSEPIAPQQPAVPVKKSVFPGYLVCLEDGKQMTMLKRHLQTSYGMTPSEYRIKWGLPAAYPMVAPDYAARRSVLAKQIGLGRKIVVAPVEVPVKRIPLGKRGRKAKAKKPDFVPDAVVVEES